MKRKLTAASNVAADPCEKLGLERRHLPRYALLVEASFEVGQKILWGEVHNLNFEGAYLRSEVILPPFSTLKRLSFRLPNGHDIEIDEALVVWNNDGSKGGFYPRGMGLFFVAIQPDYVNRIKEYFHDAAD